MHEKIILVGTGKGDGFGGYWGGGPTLADAKKKFRAAGGRKITGGWRFTSNLPFAPPDRAANDDESDAYIARDGTVCWTRAKREELVIVKA